MTYKQNDIIKVGKSRYRCIISNEELAVFGKYTVKGGFEKTDYCDVRVVANNYGNGFFQILGVGKS